MVISPRVFLMAFLAGLFTICLPSSFAADAGEATNKAESEIKTALAKLPAADKTVALSQRWCPIQQGNRLGSMGTPVKVVVAGKPVFLCCAGCKKKAIADEKGTLKAAETLKKVNAALEKLSPADRAY